MTKTAAAMAVGSFFIDVPFMSSRVQRFQGHGPRSNVQSPRSKFKSSEVVFRVPSGA